MIRGLAVQTKLKAMLISIVLLPSFAMAQTYDSASEGHFDQYGQPLPSIRDMCRSGQMAGGPITAICAENDYRFNQKGERLVRYDFTKWGYNLLTSVPEAIAHRLDTDQNFRASYIRSNHIQPYVKHTE